MAAAIDRTNHVVRYDGSYFSIAYPNGDVPANIGVCTDVVIHSYRALGTDLQRLVHEDMPNNFDRYPSKLIWGLTSTDRNIDHRRVPNLKVFFSRHGMSLSISYNKQDYAPGDLVTWMFPVNLPHIGIMTNQKLETLWLFTISDMAQKKMICFSVTKSRGNIGLYQKNIIITVKTTLKARACSKRYVS